ncbi:MAG: TonB-dependent receptor [Flavobacteriales bacterium]|nr:TonB-dependent receptor [Flavobacteriales bacterium]
MKSILNLCMKLFFVLLSCSSTFAQDQDGYIRGTVFDGTSGETIPMAKVYVSGTQYRAKTDLDGKMNIKIPAGTYELKIAALLKDTMTITGVEVKAGEATVLDDIVMTDSSNTFDVVIVDAERITNTENAMLNIRRMSSHPIDAITSEQFRKTGDPTAAGALKRVPGVSLAGGKYIYVRGLGDRYNKTTLNGTDIPGLDPDRNSIQMDIFPTSVLGNIVVHKSFVAELPADFTGGVVDIGLKSFPDKRNRGISVGLGYNPSFHFQSDYLTYDGGKLDFLGFDDGTRKIPVETYIPFFSEAVSDPNGQDGQRYKQILESFNPTLAAYETRSLMDFSIGGSFGNQIKKKKVTLGYNTVISYKNSTDFYREAQFSRYGLSGDASETEMQERELQVGKYGANNVLLSGLVGFAIKTQKTKMSLNVLHLQNGESKAGIFDYSNADQGAIFYGFQHNLEYSQRSLTNVMLNAKHRFAETGWEFEWKVSPTLSLITDPDIRFTRYENRDGDFWISTETGFPERIWRELQEQSINGVAHATKEFKFAKRKAKFKFGGGHTYKQRDFVVRNFALNIRNVPLTGDPNELFLPENIWPLHGDPTSGTTYEASFLPSNPNQFSANIQNTAAYVATEISPLKKVRAIIGVRVENYVQRYTGQDQLGVNVLDNDKVLNDLGIFPSANFVYTISDIQNLRFSYGKTVARPSFKELSYAEIYDPITGRIFVGGLFRDANDLAGVEYWDGNLTKTDIHNFDVRWEIFPSRGQTISFSAFYKKFFNPIEIVQFATQAGSYQPRNVGDGQVIGGEIEIRQSLKVLAKSLEDFTFNLNVTLTESRIEFSQTEYDSRVENAREGQTIGQYRDMAGQAPYVINSGLSYNGGEKGFWQGLEAGIFYNVQGPTLQFVGIVDRPDIYSVPFHSLNFNANKTFGKDGKFRLGFKVSNILNDDKEAVFKSFQASDQYFSRLSPGTSMSLKFSMNF